MTAAGSEAVTLALDPRMPAPERLVLRHVLDRWASERPEQVFAQFEDGSTWTYAQTRAIVRRTAAGLRALGVRQGDHVAVFLPNSPASIEVWFALNYLGAVYVPINPGYRGNLLSHALDVADGRLCVAHPELAPRLEGIERHRVETVVTSDDPVLRGSGDDPGELERPIRPWDTWGIMFTSGTTGPSKGVLSSYLHQWAIFGPDTMPFITGDDRYMINLPLFHMGGCGLLNAMLLRGGSIAFVTRFSTPRFWATVRETRSTVVFLLGTMASFVQSQPPGPDDRDHPLRLVFMVPVVDDVPAFAARFGVEVRSLYGMTEISSPIITGPTPSLPGTCGRARPGVEVRLLDANDCEVPVGEVGEFCVRTDMPWAMNHGYHRMPEPTARAWRNGWFHTGDAGRRDADGNFFFVDRFKDAVRRRGEYISSLELETEINAHPSIAASAVVGVPAEHGEEEVLACLVAAPGADVDVLAVTEFLRERVPHFMVPRYLRVLDALPMTPTAKVLKTVLRDDGVTADTWDREAAGIRIRAEAVG
jgi:crotonobetaine/carnitine-CoA ligase